MPHELGHPLNEGVADLEAGHAHQEPQVPAHLAHHGVAVVNVIFLGDAGRIIKPVVRNFAVVEDIFCVNV